MDDWIYRSPFGRSRVSRPGFRSAAKGRDSNGDGNSRASNQFAFRRVDGASEASDASDLSAVRRPAAGFYASHFQIAVSND